ncbi:C1QL4-like protein [Mya arenaria]|uniref:C1QL4-like protein n=2 Tax=Mya arenaria TaxID=6604 RepID=A0ABY7DCD8_MYAAR|nr:C1QL4-like protein [Mya arenaria]
MVRLEFLVEQFKEEMNNFRREKDETFTEIRNEVASEVTKAKESVEADKETLARALSDLQMVNNNLTAQASKAIEHLQDAKKRVSFSAKTVESKSSSYGEVIIFSETVQDTDCAYNNKSGKFVVPVPGTYVFTTHLCVYSGNTIYFAIRHNVDVVARSSVFNSANCNTLETIRNVNTGHEVYVTYEISGHKVYPDDSTRWNTFSGRLIYDMP